MSISKSIIGTAGEYYVCAELCRRNILALITPKNNPLFDIVATDTVGKRRVAIQVKTMGIGNKQGWKLSKDIVKKQRNPNLFVVLVNMKKDGMNEYYIYEYDKLSKRIQEVYNDYIGRPKKDGSRRKDVKFRWFDLRYFSKNDKSRLNNWELLGFGIPDHNRGI